MLPLAASAVVAAACSYPASGQWAAATAQTTLARLAARVVTADAPHTRREHVRFLTQDQQAHYLLVVKNNQPSLLTALRSPPWSRGTARHAARSRGHGRRRGWTFQARTTPQRWEEPTSDAECAWVGPWA
ncbi:MULTISPECIES: hypothetical protein [unclassified Streptomyces]|uniref:hypothetical protein n=1 Tax=unclassified Streptomyces TaxID=2593676 RepID=UPI00365C85D5